MKRKASSELEDKPAKAKKSKNVFTGSDFMILLSDATSAFTALSAFIKSAEAHLEDNSQEDVVSIYCRSTSDGKEILNLLSPNKHKSQEAYLVLESVRLIVSRVFGDLKQYEIVGQAMAKKLVSTHVNDILTLTSMKNKSPQIKLGLKLLTLLSKGSSGRWGWICKEISSRVDFGNVNWISLVNRKDSKDVEDVKFHLMDLVCGLLSTCNMSVIKSLCEAKNFMPTLFESLHGDTCLVICKFLTAIQDHIINNPVLTKTFKVRIFNEKALKSLTRLYVWVGPKGWQEMAGAKKDKTKKSKEEKHTPFELDNLTEEQEVVRCHVHKVLLELCSSFKNGVVFKDRSAPLISGQNSNRTITSVLQNLPQSFYKDDILKDLVLRILRNCPDQLHFFLGAPSFAACLSPRASKNWFSCCEFVSQVFREQAVIPRLFPLFLLSGDPQKMAENYAKTVLPPMEIWKRFTTGLLESNVDHVVVRCLDFLSINCERLREAADLMKEERLSNGSIYAENTQLFNEFEVSFRGALGKNLPSVSQMVQCLERFVRKQKEAVGKESNSEDNLKKETVLGELPPVSSTETVGKFLKVICLLGSHNDAEDVASDEWADDIVTYVEMLLSEDEKRGSTDGENIKTKKKRKSDAGDASEADGFRSTKAADLQQSRTMLSYFWKLVHLKKIALQKFLRGNAKASVVEATLRLLADKCVGGDDDNDDALLHVMLLDAFSQVMMDSGIFSCMDEVRSWLRNLTPVRVGQLNPQKFSKKCIRYFHNLLHTLVSSESTDKPLATNLFLTTALDKYEGDTFTDVFLDRSLCDIIASVADPVELSTKLQTHPAIQDGRLSRSKLLVEILSKGKKSKGMDFEVDEEVAGVDARSSQHRLQMLAFAAALEAFQITKIQSSSKLEKRLKRYLDEIAEGFKKLDDQSDKRSTSRSLPRTETTAEECDDEDDDEDDSNLKTRPKHARGLVFQETCDFVFGRSFLQTFFVNPSAPAASKIVNEWFASMLVKLLQNHDHQTVQQMFVVPIKKLQECLVADFEDGNKTHTEPDHQQSMMLVKSFSTFLPLNLVETFCLNFLLDGRSGGESCGDDDVLILVELGSKIGKDELTDDSLLSKTTKYLKKRIMSGELCRETLSGALNFIINLMRIQPSRVVELLSLKKTKKKTKSLFSHLISSAEETNMTFIQNMLVVLPADDKCSILDLVSDWLDCNSEVWMQSSVWMNYFELLVEFIRSSAASTDSVKFVGRFLWVQMMKMVCSSGDLKDGGSEFMSHVLQTLEDLPEVFQKIRSKEVMDSVSEHWNKFVKVGLKYHLKNKSFINVLSSVIHYYVADGACPTSVSSSSLRPSVCDVFNMVVGHSMFMNIALSETNSLEKESIFRLLQTLASKSSGKCCTADLVPLLFGAFSATLSTTDECILSLLHMSEKNGSDIVQHKPYYWGQKAIDYQTSKKALFTTSLFNHGVNEFIDQIDAKLMLETAIKFPFSCKLNFSDFNPFEKENVFAIESRTPEPAGIPYNPSYFLTALHHLMTENVDCRKFVEKNCLGLLIASLTSHEASVRNLGTQLLTKFRGHLNDSKFVDKQQAMYLLDALKNGIDVDDFKLPSIMSVFLIRAANVILKPDSHMYVLINQFLLLKPALDLQNVPEFYKLFFSSSLEHKKERSWVLEMLADGIRETKDYHICEKRKVFKCIMSFYASPICDQQNKVQVLNILLNICSNSRSVVWNVVKKHGFLSWITSAFFAFSGNLNKKSSTNLPTQQNSNIPSSLQTIMGKLVRLLTICWQAVSFSASPSRDEKTTEDELKACSGKPLLPPAVLAEFLLTVEHLLLSDLWLSSDLKTSLSKLSLSVKREASRTSAVFNSRGFIFPIPADLL